VVAGGTCNCKSSANYTREGEFAGRRARTVSPRRV
jgi:hypothetical protein